MRKVNGQGISAWAGDRTMYPPVQATESRGRGIQREIVAGDRDRRVDVRIWRRPVDKIVVVSCEEENNKRGLIRVVW